MKCFRFAIAKEPRGFTILESLIVVAILALIMAFLLPAIGSVRAAGDRAECLNRLRQIGAAVAGYESTYQISPAASYIGVNWYSVQVRLLPYLGLELLYNEIPFERGMWKSEVGRTTPPMRQAPAIFRCPADAAAAGMVNYRNNFGDSPSADSGRITDRGPFTEGRSVRAAEIVDGRVKTIYFSERIVGDYDELQYSPDRDLWHPVAAELPRELTAADYRIICGRNIDPSRHRSRHGDHWMESGLNHTGYNHILPPNSDIPDCGRKGFDYSSAAVSARSFHFDGVQCLFGDGSATFIDAEISPAIWIAYATRSGLETAQ